jgi:hypothetical protein
MANAPASSPPTQTRREHRDRNEACKAGSMIGFLNNDRPPGVNPYRPGGWMRSGRMQTIG